MHRAFCAEIRSGVIELSIEESHHVLNVLRMKEGDIFELIDGKGCIATAKILNCLKRRCLVEAFDPRKYSATFKVNLAFGLPKATSLDFLIRRSTEIGVASFQPLITRHSLPIAHWNEDRWKKVVIEVAKQCQALYFPELKKPLKLTEWFSVRGNDSPLFFCHETRRGAFNGSITGSVFDLLVGPEGGWSSDEASIVDQHRGISLGLGENRLRTETAAFTGIVIIKRAIGEL